MAADSVKNICIGDESGPFNGFPTNIQNTIWLGTRSSTAAENATNNTINIGNNDHTVMLRGGSSAIDIGSATLPWGDLYVDNGSFNGNVEANYFVATAANSTNSASKIVTEMHQSNEGGHSVYGSTTSSAAQYLIKLKSSDASVSNNALLLTETLAQFGTGRITIGNQGTSNRLISMGYQEQWEFYQNSQTTLQFRKGTATTKPIYEVDTGGNFKLNQYGSGTITGTATYNLEVDSSGKINRNTVYKSRW